MIRSIFLALALLLPVSWTVARAADEAPADGAKKEKIDRAARTRPGVTSRIATRRCLLLFRSAGGVVSRCRNSFDMVSPPKHEVTADR